MQSPITLTGDQEAAYQAFVQFILHPEHQVFVLEGFAGTGKSTLVNKMLSDLPATLKAAKLLTMDDNDWEVELTATTNKACEALQDIIGVSVRTIQSALGMRVHKDYKTGKTSLKHTHNSEVLYHKILFIDEASFIDHELLKLIFEWTEACKIVFIGDPAQLAPVKSSGTPVFEAGFPTARLEQVVRQADGNQIKELATAFRETVRGAPFPSGIVPDGKTIVYCDRETFNQHVLEEFTREDWHYTDSKFLAWTNRRVNEYNEAIRNRVHGDPIIQVGDYVTCNKHISTINCKLKTDQMVLVTRMEKATDYLYDGWKMQVDRRHYAFMPASAAIRKEATAYAKANNDLKMLRKIEEEWIDLRAVYAQTVNKSQGSTYNKAFIDLDDIGNCNQANSIARMMYVAVSRARFQVFLTGDLVKRAQAA